MNLYFLLIPFLLITFHCIYSDDKTWNNSPPYATIYIGENCTQPIITGFQGQSFEFRGIPNEIFNLITSPHLHVNARFVYVQETGGCHYNHTTCTGTYMSEIGIKAPQHTYHIIGHQHQQGLQIKVNGQPQPINTTVSYDENRNMMDTSDDITISIISNDRIELKSPLFDITFIHTNGFLNLIITLKDTELHSTGVAYHHYDEDRSKYSTDNIYPFYPVHGLIGQTWRNAVYGASKLPYEGEWDSYLIQSARLFGTGCEFNYYQH